VVSTHQIEDIHSAYERVAVLVKGRVEFDGSISEFLSHAEIGVNERDRAASAYAKFVVAED
jgi:ABC-type multidrug transport system ATPase subunit